jgi:hypothetical protein
MSPFISCIYLLRMYSNYYLQPIMSRSLQYNWNDRNTRILYNSLVSRIYYINLKKNFQRRKLMEEWLGKQPIPYQRIEGIVGTDSDCNHIVHQTPKRCRGITGLAKTNLDIIQNKNVSGLTIVFEDDFYINVDKTDLNQAVETTLQFVPNDWDIIRWECNGPIRSSFPVVVNNSKITVFRTAHMLPCTEETCTFCGSTHAMLWRDSSLSKIKELWSIQPYDDIDCLLVTDKINSYCVNMNLGVNQPPAAEWSDVTY